jgi:hypothetical protein
MNKKLEELKTRNEVLEKMVEEHKNQVERVKDKVRSMELEREEQRKEQEERKHRLHWFVYVVLAILILFMALLLARPDLWNFA